jgi:ketosteroid isomerase-like protein
MNEPVSRVVVDRFYQAYDSRDAERIGAVLDDNVEWDVFGPVAVMQVCGHWRGKTAVIDRFARVVPRLVDFKKFERDFVMVDGDQSAACGRLISAHRASGRIISHRVAHFIRYRDSKVISFRSINDTLDAAEQFIGHRIDLGTDKSNGDLVAV